MCSRYGLGKDFQAGATQEQMGTQTNAVILPGYRGSFLCTVQLQEEMESEARRPHWGRALTPLCARDVYARINDEDKAQYGHWCIIPPPN